MPDINLTCVDCNKPFYHSEKDQEFYRAQNFVNLPKRCLACRQQRRHNRVLPNASRRR